MSDLPDSGTRNITNMIGLGSADPFTAMTTFGLNSLFDDDDDSGRDSSGDVAAQTGYLLRSQYEDWKKTFMPIELQQLQQVSFNNPTVLPNALKESEATVRKSFGSMEGVLERQNRGLGLMPTQREGDAAKRMMDLNEASTLASAKNATRSNVRQMDEAILMGATPNPNIAKAKSGVAG